MDAGSSKRRRSRHASIRSAIRASGAATPCSPFTTTTSSKRRSSSRSTDATQVPSSDDVPSARNPLVLSAASQVESASPRSRRSSATSGGSTFAANTQPESGSAAASAFDQPGIDRAVTATWKRHVAGFRPRSSAAGSDPCDGDWSVTTRQHRRTSPGRTTNVPDRGTGHCAGRLELIGCVVLMCRSCGSEVSIVRGARHSSVAVRCASCLTGQSSRCQLRSFRRRDR